MNKHNCRLLTLLLLVLFACDTHTYGQDKNEDEVVNSNIYLSQDVYNRIVWVPSLLNAGQSPLYTMVQYNGSNISWTLRGRQDQAIIIDGVNWASPLKKIRLTDLYSGLQNELSSQNTIMNGAFSENGYVAELNAHYLNSISEERRKTISISLGFGNTINANNINFHFNNDAKENKWHYSIGARLQQSQPGFLLNGFKHSQGIVFLAEKPFLNKSRIGFSLIWDYSDQSKSATVVNEVHELSRQRNYNPGWGWYHQQLFYPNSKQTNAPIFTLKYQKFWNENAALIISNALIIGLQSQSSLEWTKTADPRPDYYRYLPSYIKDTALRAALIEWDIKHPENLQIQFDKLEKINQAKADRRSFYIINQQNESIALLHGSVIYRNLISGNSSFQIGANYAFDQIHYYNTIKNLLGGNFFYNYNSWINDDGTELSFQNDINHPDRKIRLGENWGADYSMCGFKIRSWTQLDKEWKSVATKFAIGYGIAGMGREGYNANGLFSNASKGKSVLTISPSWDFKGAFIYKFNGRAQFSSMIFGQWVAPDYNQLYINPQMSSYLSPYQQMTFNNGFEISFRFHAPIIKFSATAYYRSALNQSTQSMFYHDGYAGFVYALSGNIADLSTGFESSVEANLFPNLKLNLVTTIQSNNHVNDPLYQLLFVNDLHILESGLLHLKNLSSSTSPKIVNALSLHFQPYNSLLLNITMLYAQSRSMAFDYFRRSDFVKNKIDAISWGRLIQVNYLPDNVVVNASLYKSYQFKYFNSKHRYRIGVSARNIFNMLLPIIASEQNRFDYIHFDKYKYAPKYLFDQGVTYALHLQLQIQ